MLNRNQITFVKAAEELFGVGAILTRDGIQHVCEENDLSFPYWFVTKSEYRHDRGHYKLPNIGTKPKVEEVKQEEELVMENVVALRQPRLVDDSDVSIPTKYPDYVPFGFYNDLRNIIRSNDFYPVFVTGLSGNGKTLMVEQVCVELKRECIRVNVSIETDESEIGRAHV